MDAARREGISGPQLPGRLTAWAALLLWLLLLVALEVFRGPLAAERRHLEFMLAAAGGSLIVVTAFALYGLPGVASELRSLRIMAVVLPSAFVVLVEITLYLLNVFGPLSELGQHALAAGLLSAGTIPFSLYVFREFARLRDELAARALHLEALHGASVALTREPELGALPSLTARSASSVVRADRVALWFPSGSELHREGIGELTVWPGGTGALDADLLDQVIAEGRATISSVGTSSLLVVPVMHRGRAAGAILAVRDDGAPFDTEDELMLDMFAVAASAGFENARRLQEAQVLATIEERERIARDLHDDLGQLLGFLTTKIQAVQQFLATGRSEPAQRELAGLEEATRMLGAQVREAILGLRARVGPDRPLWVALQEYAADFEVLAGIRTTFDGEEDAARGLLGASQYQLLRIAQEAMSNARRHAKAGLVCVGLHRTDGRLELTVRDDGRGFSTELARGGFGLKTMSERARAIGGELRIDSRPGRGTVVRAIVPLGGQVRS